MKQTQKIWNIVVPHLFKQGISSRDTHGNCSYRVKNGTKCAVGILVKDGCYDPEMESKGIDDVFVKDILESSGWATGHKTMTLLGSLQGLHDLFDPSCWESRLKLLGIEFELIWPETKVAAP